jgi:hypothetical protein
MRDTNLVNALREHADWWENGDMMDPLGGLEKDLFAAADRLENQNAHIAALQQEIETLRGQLPRWIPVEARLPENFQNVLCWGEYFRFRHEDNGNCTAVGGFCTAVQAAHCPLLRQYLDTGMTPEAFQSYVVFLQDLIGNQKASEALDRFRQLVKADRAGRLVVLPCKAGDTVYEVTSRKTISEYRVKAIRMELFCTCIEWDIVAGFVDKSIFGVSVDEIGKTVFLTREEAEAALEAMKDE